MDDRKRRTAAGPGDARAQAAIRRAVERIVAGGSARVRRGITVAVGTEAASTEAGTTGGAGTGGQPAGIPPAGGP